jgi:transcriptional regulator with XRE-family HTH domain
MSIDQHVARRIKGKRMALGLSEDDLAKAIGVERGQVAEYERAATRVPPDQLLRLSEFMDVPISYFFPSALSPGY